MFYFYLSSMVACSNLNFIGRAHGVYLWIRKWERGNRKVMILSVFRHLLCDSIRTKMKLRVPWGPHRLGLFQTRESLESSLFCLSPLNIMLKSEEL